ncbi:MAG: histidinol phosphate phosphatase [Rubrobacter sp.]|jgi:myo-inositol-1(or 4)-monophosphatase|nr:histidinol phosphate phosphatase [Rubrobacter sp.]
MAGDLNEYMDFAVEAAWKAGRLTLAHFQTGVKTEYKGDETEVTVADTEAEALLRRDIGAKYPAHDIVGEEFGGEGSGASPRWILDPIDGTQAFARGVPLYATLVGLEIDGDVKAGAAYFPALDEMVYAADGLGCFWNGRRAKVSDVSSLERAIACFTQTANFEKGNRSAEWEEIQKSVLACRGWSDAYGHALVATGRAEIMLDPLMNPWDCAPFIPILREAGGFFGDWSGNETIYAGEAMSVNTALLPEVLRLIENT